MGEELIGGEGSASGAVAVKPFPEWVDRSVYAVQPPEPTADWTGGGVCRLVQDAQVNLCGSDYAWFYRSAQRVLTRAGAERAAHFAIEFDPSYQHLQLHSVAVLRGAERIEHARTEEIRVFRRESNLERLVLDGRSTASLIVPDVRVDDIVEIALTIEGNNPVLQGKRAAWAVFDPCNPWYDMRFRILRATPRELFLKPFNNPPPRELAVKDGVEESRWRLLGTSRRDPEPLTPPGISRLRRCNGANSRAGEK